MYFIILEQTPPLSWNENIELNYQYSLKSPLRDNTLRGIDFQIQQKLSSGHLQWFLEFCYCKSISPFRAFRLQRDHCGSAGKMNVYPEIRQALSQFYSPARPLSHKQAVCLLYRRSLKVDYLIYSCVCWYAWSGYPDALLLPFRFCNHGTSLESSSTRKL